MKTVFFAMLLSCALSSAALTQGHGTALELSESVARQAAAKAFAEGKQVFLYNLTPNPIVRRFGEDVPATWKLSVSFFRSKTASIQSRNLRVRVVRGPLSAVLPEAPRFSGESEGAITFDVPYEIWMMNGQLFPGSATFTLVVQGAGEARKMTVVSNTVEGSLSTK